MTQPATRNPSLIVTAGTQACAIPLDQVVETMRPLPIEPIAQAPAFISGVAVIRGDPLPVVDLELLVQGPGRSRNGFGRLVTIKLGERRAALGVETVVGVRAIDSTTFRELPPILSTAAPGLIDAIGASDAQLLLVLRTARIVPEEVWNTVDSASARR